jgi:hypothetical protein
MKKLLMIIFLLIFWNSGYSMMRDSDTFLLNVGSSSFSGVMDKPVEMGINCALSVNRLHFDVSSNLMNDNRSMDLSVANVGYIIPVNFMVSFVPVLGFGISNGIHAGSYHCDIMHGNDSTYYYNAGFICLMKLSKRIGMYTGIGTFESFRMGITIALK